MSCKYYYRGGLCANSQMEKPFCIGQENCDYINGSLSDSSEEVSSVNPSAGSELELNTEVVENEAKDSMSQWMGVYCPHYKRFFCTGSDSGCKSGCCETADDYHDALAKHMEKVK